MARSCALCGKVSMGGFNPQSSGMNRVRAHRRMQPNLQPLVIDVKGVADQGSRLHALPPNAAQDSSLPPRSAPADRSPTRPVVLCPASGGATSFHLTAEVSGTRASASSGRIGAADRRLNGTSSVEWNTRCLHGLACPSAQVARTRTSRTAARVIRAACRSISRDRASRSGRPWPSISFHSVSSSSSLPREDDLDRGADRGPRRPRSIWSPRATCARGRSGARAGSRRAISPRAISSASVMSRLVEAFDESPGLAAVGRAELADPSGLGRRLRLGRFLGLGLGSRGVFVCPRSAAGLASPAAASPFVVGSASASASATRRFFAPAGFGDSASDGFGSSGTCRALLDAFGKWRLDGSLLAGGLDGLSSGRQRPERPAHQRQPELIRLGRIDDHPRPGLRLDLEPAVLRLPPPSAEPLERIRFRHVGSIGALAVPLGGVEPDRERAVVDELDRHLGTEPARRHGDPERAGARRRTARTAARRASGARRP